MREIVGPAPPAKAKKTRLLVDTSDDKGYWYALVGFVVAVLGSLLYVTLLAYMDGEVVLQGSFILTWLLGLAALGLFTYPAKLLDAAYIRSLQPVWQPRMWYWFLIGFGLPILAFTVSWPMFGTGVAVLLAIAVFILVTLYMCGSFLYRRFVYIGDPSFDRARRYIRGADQ